MKQYKATGFTQSIVKRYVALLIFLTIQSVCLELSGDMSTDNFVLALNHYVARRGEGNTL